MSPSYRRAPHVGSAPTVQAEAPNAALLIDFDNVTMGMRSDLSKELKNLLNSDIIKGKVTVQRAYADWRRYPQYIVPLSENSVDLIFAPAYGSSKKNATDIRMAIDAMELVFIRPEIGTFILLTGDSDFSSVVLKLKEYGKYVIGVGIQESSSDILVQNCDEYYSYTSLTGLRKTTDAADKPVDPWVLVEEAVARMASRKDVMRSDRLKQVMMEIDPTFDEGNFGFSKFSRFLTEAASRDLVRIRKLENGQYEVAPVAAEVSGEGKPSSESPPKPSAKERSRGRSRGGGAVARKAAEEKAEAGGADQKKRAAREPEGEGTGEVPEGEEGGDPLRKAYALLKRALELLTGSDGSPVRDSDLKRKMLELDPAFDESELGFGKFHRFLRQAHDHEVVDLEKRGEGTYQVSVRGAQGAEPAAVVDEPGAGAAPAGPDSDASGAPLKAGGQETPSEGKEPSEEEARQEMPPSKPILAGTLRIRRGGMHLHRPPQGPPPLLEGQVVPPGAAEDQPTSAPAGGVGARKSGRRTPPGPSAGRGARSPALDTTSLGLPTEPSAVTRYLANSYKGVGLRTAGALVEKFGEDLYRVLQEEPERISEVIPERRAERLLEGWRADLARRLEKRNGAPDSAPPSAPEPNGRERPARRRRTRRSSRRPSRGEPPEETPGSLSE